jgi:hypothetical protein
VVGGAQETLLELEDPGDRRRRRRRREEEGGQRRTSTWRSMRSI